MLPKSLQRTDSTGQLNVFILLKKKSNNELLIVSREDLPPTLRTGRLLLNQKIIIRDDERNSIEGVIVYIHADRENCVAFKKQMSNNSMQHTKELNESISSSISEVPSSSSHTVNGSTLSKNISKKTSKLPVRVTQKPSKPSTANKQSVESHSKPLYKCNNQQHDDSINYEARNDISDLSFSPTTNLNEKHKSQSTFANTWDTSFTITDDYESDILIDKINQQSAQINRLKQIIKERDIEIKRLRSTTIELPTEQGTRDYICYMADKIRQNTTEYKYTGNLSKDAKCLGIDVVQLNECLTAKASVTTIARNIFKKIVPENKRTVSCWNDLPEEVLLKEQMLIKFLKDYFGPLEVDSKKVHTSLCGCLRNDRGKQNKLKQRAEKVLNNDKDSSHQEEINYVDDDNEVNDDDDDN
ncbi:unnamed protein product [Adineta steineri]|uniref:BEN domain-containing protein n=1 Tax=Adineta steineri TaxID=433720 RepID=A0A819DL69_9BILA|nr:unnamed protein product [Adineta steineri]